MTGPGEQIVFEMSVFTHADAHKERGRMEAINDLVAHARNEVISRSAMHASDHTTVTVQVTVADIEPGRIYDPLLNAYGDPLESCQELRPGELVDICDDDSFRTSNFIGFAVTYIVIFLFGFLLHAGLSLETPASKILSMTDKQIEVDLAYYQGKLSNASGAGCQMSVDEFRSYHDLQNERGSRALK